MKHISEYYHLYEKVKNTKESFKIFSVVHQKQYVAQYLRKNKKLIISNINYAFFESDENYILSVFKGKKSNYIHINSKLTKNVPQSIIESISGFEKKDWTTELTIYQYENWLAIFGTFIILLDGINTKLVKDFNDNMPYTIQDLLKDSRNESFLNDTLFSLTQVIYYDDDFRINLESFVNNENKILKFVYRYGYDFLLQCFKAYHKNELYADTIKEYIKATNDEFKELYSMFENKIILES